MGSREAWLPHRPHPVIGPHSTWTVGGAWPPPAFCPLFCRWGICLLTENCSSLSWRPLGKSLAMKPLSFRSDPQPPCQSADKERGEGGGGRGKWKPVSRDDQWTGPPLMAWMSTYFTAESALEGILSEHRLAGQGHLQIPVLTSLWFHCLDPGLVFRETDLSGCLPFCHPPDIWRQRWSSLLVFVLNSPHSSPSYLELFVVAVFTHAFAFSFISLTN